MSRRTVGVGEVEVDRAAARHRHRVLLRRGRQSGGEQRLLELELLLRHRRPRGPFDEQREALPRGRPSAAPAAHVVVHLADLGVRAQPLVPDVLDHREVARLIEDATEIEHRPRHRRDPSAVHQFDDVVIREPVAVVDNSSAVVDAGAVRHRQLDAVLRAPAGCPSSWRRWRETGRRQGATGTARARVATRRRDRRGSTARRGARGAAVRSSTRRRIVREARPSRWSSSSVTSCRRRSAMRTIRGSTVLMHRTVRKGCHIGPRWPDLSTLCTCGQILGRMCKELRKPAGQLRDR